MGGKSPSKFSEIYFQLLLSKYLNKYHHNYFILKLSVGWIFKFECFRSRFQEFGNLKRRYFNEFDDIKRKFSI